MQTTHLFIIAILAFGAHGSNVQATSSTASGPLSNRNTVLLIHGILMSVAFVVLYPIGAMAIRSLSFKGLLWFHAGLMIFTYIIVLAGAGFGAKVGSDQGLMSSSHVGLGLVVVIGLLLQPITGWIHHKIYKKTGAPSRATPLHVWFGRAIITIGIASGVTGLQQANETMIATIVYGVVAGVMWLAWVASIVYASRKAKNVAGGGMKLTQLRSHQHGGNLQDDREV